MNRDDLQRVAVRRLDAAKSLLMASHWDSAYYIAGYAIECALKACIARQFREFDFPDKKTVFDSYTHDLSQLVKTAGLAQKLKKAADDSRDFRVNWATVKDWSEDSRYEDRTRKEAAAIIEAIEGAQHGVLEWIKAYW